MTIVTRGYGGQAIVTWGYGDLSISILTPFISEIIGAKFSKLNSKLARYTILDDTTAYFERIIAETSDEPVVTPPDGVDLVIVPNVFVSFNGFDRLEIQFDTTNTLDAFMDRVISEEPIVQGFPGDNLDLQILPNVSVTYEKSDGLTTNHEISDEIGTEFIRIIAEEI